MTIVLTQNQEAIHNPACQPNLYAVGMLYGPVSYEPLPSPRPSVRRLRRLAAALADGRRPDLSDLSLDDLRDLWRLLALLDRLRAWRNEPPPEPKPDAPRLTTDEGRTVLISLRVPIAGRVVEEILQEPMMLVALASIDAVMTALLNTPRRP